MSQIVVSCAIILLGFVLLGVSVVMRLQDTSPNDGWKVQQAFTQIVYVSQSPRLSGYTIEHKENGVYPYLAKKWDNKTGKWALYEGTTTAADAEQIILKHYAATTGLQSSAPKEQE